MLLVSPVLHDWVGTRAIATRTAKPWASLCRRLDSQLVTLRHENGCLHARISGLARKDSIAGKNRRNGKAAEIQPKHTLSVAMFRIYWAWIMQAERKLASKPIFVVDQGGCQLLELAYTRCQL
ncbi:MAG: hypothetical protein Aurels2KO_53000 [Aureliella sp.]